MIEERDHTERDSRYHPEKIIKINSVLSGKFPESFQKNTKKILVPSL
jgi:hypothetical protein